MTVTSNPNQQNNIQKENNEIHQEQHQKKFGFIKKGNENKNENKNEEHKKETPNVNKKVNIQILYKEKLMKYNSNMFDYNQNFKNFVRKISLIRSEIAELKNNKKQLNEDLKNLTKMQNDLAESNKFDEAIKVEEEIDKKNQDKKNIELLIKEKNEKELNEAKILIVDLMREKTDFYDSYLISFPMLIQNAEK